MEMLHDKIRLYNDMIYHMPHGVGIWRLERGINTTAVLRLACANKLASQYVGAPLIPGSLIHEILPGSHGVEVHRFLEDVVRNQRVITLDSFRIGPHNAFSVTAYPLYPDFAVVIMDPPKNSPPPTTSTSNISTLKEKNEEWVSVVASSGMAVAACDSTHVLHANEHFAALLAVPQSYIVGRDILAVLESRVRSTSRAYIEQLRRAIRERVVHHVEIELEHFAWRMSVHPMGEGTRHTLVLAHRTRTLAPQVHQPGRPMFPIFPSSFQPSSSPLPQESKMHHESPVYKDAIDHIPCGIVIVKKDEEPSETSRPQFRVVSVNHAAQAMAIAKNLSQGHRFDETSSPFDPAFVRTLLLSTKSQESRVAQAAYKIGARIVPLHDSAHIAILFEDAALFESQSHFDIPRTSSKRTISDLVDPVDRGYPIFPSHSHPTKFKRPHSKENLLLPFSSHAASPILPPLQLPLSPPLASSPVALSRSDKLERLVQHCVVGMACLDSSGSITLANKAFVQMLGYSESELPSPHNAFQSQSTHAQHMIDMVHPDDAAQARSVMRQVVSGELHSFDMPLRFVHKQQHNVVSAVASFMPIEKGVVLQVQQPSRLKHFPEVLLSDRDVLRSAFREMVVGTAVLDIEEHPRIVSANSGFCAIMGSTESELSGRSLVETLHPNDRDAVLAVAHDLVTARTTRSQLLSVRSHPRSGPARFGALSLSAILDSKSTPFLMIAQLQLVDKPFS